MAAAASALSALANAIGDRDGLEELQALFRELDTDGSGELDRKEFFDALTKFGLSSELDSGRSPARPLGSSSSLLLLATAALLAAPPFLLVPPTVGHSRGSVNPAVEINPQVFARQAQHPVQRSLLVCVESAEDILRRIA